VVYGPKNTKYVWERSRLKTEHFTVNDHFDWKDTPTPWQGVRVVWNYDEEWIAVGNVVTEPGSRGTWDAIGTDQSGNLIVDRHGRTPGIPKVQERLRKVVKKGKGEPATYRCLPAVAMDAIVERWGMDLLPLRETEGLIETSRGDFVLLETWEGWMVRPYPPDAGEEDEEFPLSEKIYLVPKDAERQLWKWVYGVEDEYEESEEEA
ncbi:hypothetical protein ACFL2Q_17440, partial [Thermodesulfobacteriota bacterium]